MTAFGKAWGVVKDEQPQDTRSDENVQEILVALDGATNLIWNLYERWQDEGPPFEGEEPYEDFSQYQEAIQRNWPYKIFASQPEPFSFDFKDNSGDAWRVKIENGSQLMLVDLVAR